MGGTQGPQMKKGLLICFTGVDGGGKTTLAKSLQASLSKRGLKSIYVYSRMKAILSKPVGVLGRIFLLRGRNYYRDYKGYSSAKSKIFRSGFLSTAYRNLLFADYLIQLFFKVRLPLALGYVVVGDRYLYDMVIIDLALDLNYSADRASRTVESAFSVVPRPDLVFLIDVPEETAYARKTDVPALDYLTRVRGFFLEIGARQEMVKLDGSQPLASVQAAVEEEVSKLLARKGLAV